MTTINYTYEIVRVDPDAKAMDILYTSPEHGTMLVGGRMPWEGETVEQIAQMYSPVRNWIERTLPVATVTAGTAGNLTAALTEPDPTPPTMDDLAAFIRLERNNRLAETDWMALSDVTMSAEMAAYRQDLRDITAQAGFPHSVTWPTKPE